MKVSYKWLQSYFDEKLPTSEELSDRITFSFAEIESVEHVGNDTVLDVKVLPDRACYALSHRGIAREVSAILNVPLKNREEKKIVESPDVISVDVRIDEPELCTKFVARSMENVKVGESPAWLKEALESIGQRSINNIVDATNYVMFDIGRPLHAFDADKVKGGLVVRFARKGEVMVTLDNKRVELNNNELVIADDEGPLSLAGIKGGKRAEVDEATKNLILEAANWNPSYIRRTATSTGIKTEASKRFENRLSPLLGEEGIDRLALLIESITGAEGVRIGKREIVSFEEVHARTLEVDTELISRKLGVALSEPEIVDVLRRLGISCNKEGEKLLAHIPPERLDLVIFEDIVEEVGRIIGYDKILAVVPQAGGVTEIPTSFYYEWKIREILVNAGFSEIQTSSFSDTGEIAILKPLAEDKKYARANLRGNFEKALKMNALNAPLLGTSETRIFEIGRIFPAFAEASAGKPTSGEVTSLAIGYGGPKKKIAGELTGVVELLGKELCVTLTGEMKDGVFECTLNQVLDGLSEPKKWDISVFPSRNVKFAPFSLYPFIVRDVALFVSPLAKGVPPSSEAGDVFPSADSVAKAIKENAGQLVVRGPELFDEFLKDGKKSLAFRLVFQSFDRTLSDEEVNASMEKVYSALKLNGWEVR